MPHPATAVNTLGIKSLAGLTPNPALIPNEAPSVMTMRPINKGAMLEPGPMFLLSNNAKIVPTNMAVARSCEKMEICDQCSSLSLRMAIMMSYLLNQMSNQ